jgi:predicted dehydrogenase
MINIGVIGYGYWGPNIIRNLGQVEGASVVMCCDASPERVKRAKSQHPSLETTTDINQVLKSPSIDAVAIVTPVGTHYEFARKALEEGKHVLVEKPLTASVAEAESLLEISTKRKLTLMVDHTFIFTGAVRKMKEIVESGDVGNLYYFDSVRINLGLFQKDVNVLWDLAPHDIAILEYLVDERPTSVCANGASHFGNGIEDVAYMTLYFPSGLIAHFHNNWIAPVKVRSTLICGSKKMLVYDDMEVSEKVKVYDRGVEVKTPEEVRNALVSYRMGDMWAPRLETTEALKLMTAEFVECVQTGRTPITNGVNGLDVVRILEASEMSIKRRGKEVML